MITYCVMAVIANKEQGGIACKFIANGVDRLNLMSYVSEGMKIAFATSYDDLRWIAEKNNQFLSDNGRMMIFTQNKR